jgi:hypothetical protein
MKIRGTRRNSRNSGELETRNLKLETYFRRRMNLPLTPESIVLFYEGLIDAFVYDVQDKGVLDHLDIPQLCTNTWMQTREDRLRLAQEILTFGQSFSG